MIRIILELTEDQEDLLEFAVGDWGRSAWRYTVDNDLDPESYRHTGEDGEVDPAEQLKFASRDVAAAEAILSQLPARALQRWRNSLSDAGVGDDGEEKDA